MKTPSSYAQVAGEDGALPLPPKEEPEPPKEEPKAPEHLPPKEEPEEKFGKQGRGLGAPRSCASPSPGAVGLVSNRLPQPLALGARLLQPLTLRPADDDVSDELEQVRLRRQHLLEELLLPDLAQLHPGLAHQRGRRTVLSTSAEWKDLR